MDDDEKEELVETLKGPRFYRIMLYGYGGEAEYLKLTKAQYEFWHNHIEEHGDSDAVSYCTSAEDGEFEFEDIDELPEEMQFLKHEGEDYSSSWYESPTGFTHQWGVDYNNARITVEEVDSEEYNASVINEIVDGEDLSDYINALEEENNYELELTEMGVDEGEDTHLTTSKKEKKAIAKTVEEFDKEFLTRVEDTVLKGLNVTKEVIPGENGEPDTIRYYNDKILGRDRKTTETSATERQRGRNYQTVVADFDRTIANYTPPADDSERKQTTAEKVIGGTGLGIGSVVFARNQNRVLDDVSVNDDGSVKLRWGPPSYGNIQQRTEPFKYAAKEAMLAGNPNKMIVVNPNRPEGVAELKVRASTLAPDLNSLSFDLKNKAQLRNLIQLTTDQDATGAAKLIKEYKLN